MYWIIYSIYFLLPRKIIFVLLNFKLRLENFQFGNDFIHPDEGKPKYNHWIRSGILDTAAIIRFLQKCRRKRNAEISFDPHISKSNKEAIKEAFHPFAIDNPNRKFQLQFYHYYDAALGDDHFDYDTDYEEAGDRYVFNNNGVTVE